jgi:hypothetical protein
MARSLEASLAYPGTTISFKGDQATKAYTTALVSMISVPNVRVTPIREIEICQRSLNDCSSRMVNRYGLLQRFQNESFLLMVEHKYRRIQWQLLLFPQKGDDSSVTLE